MDARRNDGADFGENANRHARSAPIFEEVLETS